MFKERKKILSYNSREYTKDIGTKKRYYEALKDFNSGIFKKTNKCIFLDRDGVMNYEAKILDTRILLNFSNNNRGHKKDK